MDATKARCFDKLKHILITKYDVKADAITPVATLESMGLDSLTAVELAFDIEDAFKVTLAEDNKLMSRSLDVMLDRVLKASPTQAAA